MSVRRPHPSEKWDPGAETPARPAASVIVLRESERLNDTIKSFLAYARPQRVMLTRLDIRRVVQDTATLLRNSSDVREEHVVAVDGISMVRFSALKISQRPTPFPGTQLKEQTELTP